MTNLNTYITDRISHYAPGREDGGTATLQRIRRRDYANLEPQAVLIIVSQVITYLHTRHQDLETEANRLQALQPINATAYYRKDHQGQPRYLYLHHPTHNDAPRKRQYVGADPARQAQAMAHIKAYHDLVKVQTEITEVDHRLAAITGQLARALQAATMGLATLW